MIAEFESLVLNNELYVLGDFNIDLQLKGNCILNKIYKNKDRFEDFSPKIKKYDQFFFNTWFETIDKLSN